MLEIRIIKRDELEVCAQVIRDSFVTVAEGFGITVKNNPSNGAFIQAEKLMSEYDKGILMYGLYDGLSMIGFVAIEKKDEDIYYMEKLSVIPERRHEGNGTLIINFVKEKVKSLGGKKISIGIINENMILKQWYEGNGFTLIEVKRFSHLMFDVAFMEISFGEIEVV